MAEKTHAVDWWLPEIGELEKRLVNQVLESNYINDGSVTREFERKLADSLGCRHVVAVTSGTAALYLALAGLGIGHGDEVIVPDVTFIATANAVTLAGATPVLVDIDRRTLTIDPDAVRAAVTARTKAIVPVHVSGRAADLDSISDIAREFGLCVVEDAAEALLSKYRGKCLGTIGHAGVLSFSPNKTITTGQGGAVLTNDDQLHTRLRELKDQGRAVQGTGGDDRHPALGFNFKLTNLQAAIGLGQLQRLQGRVARMQRIYECYAEQLQDLPGIILPGFRTAAGETPQWVDAIVQKRDALCASLEASGMGCRRFWHPLHTQKPYRQPDERFPHSTAVAPRAMWLPSAFQMTTDDVRAVCLHIRAFERSKAAA